MDKFLTIKIFKKRSESTDSKSRIIVVTYNFSKVHGGYRYDRIGIIKRYKNMSFCYIDLYKLGYWLNRGIYLKPKVSWLIGLLGKYEIKLK